MDAEYVGGLKTVHRSVFSSKLASPGKERIVLLENVLIVFVKTDLRSVRGLIAAPRVPVAKERAEKVRSE
jgi:hypothetical protein